MTDLSKLSRAVQRHAKALDPHFMGLLGNHLRSEWQAIRAELSRLSAVEAELAGIKERIAAAPVYEIPASKPTTEDGWMRVIESVKNERSIRGQRVRLLADQEVGS